MAVKLRLKRMGRNKRPVYAIVATDSRSPRDGRYIEDIGRYAPLQDPAEVKVQVDRVHYWLDNGAQPSDTVRSMLKREGVLLAYSLKKNGASEEDIATAVEAHRVRHMAKAAQNTKLSAADRRKAALKEEEVAAKAREAEMAKKRAEMEAQAKADADAARKKAEAEREAAAAEARKEQEEANKATAAAEAPAEAKAEAAAEPEAEAPAEAAAEPEADAPAEAAAEPEAEAKAAAEPEAEAPAAEPEAPEADEEKEEKSA